jgi:hypothetical protein
MTRASQRVEPVQGLAAMAVAALLTVAGVQTNQVLLEVLFDRMNPPVEDRYRPGTDPGRLVNA